MLQYCDVLEQQTMSCRCPLSSKLLQGPAMHQTINSQQTQPSPALRTAHPPSSSAAMSEDRVGWSVAMTQRRPQSPLRALRAVVPPHHHPAFGSLVNHVTRGAEDDQQVPVEPQSPRMASNYDQGHSGIVMRSPIRAAMLERQGDQNAPHSPLRAVASLELPTEDMDEALQLQLLSPTLAAGVSTPMLHQARRVCCGDHLTESWLRLHHSSGRAPCCKNERLHSTIFCLIPEVHLRLKRRLGGVCVCNKSRPTKVVRVECPPQGLTPHLSAMSPLDAVSLQMAAALASNFASPGPPALGPLPAPGLPPPRHQHNPGPEAYGPGRGLGGHQPFRQGHVGLPPVHQPGSTTAMGTTSSAGVIAAARRAVAAAAAAAHGEYGAANIRQQQHRQQQQQLYSTTFGYRAEVSICDASSRMLLGLRA